MNNKPTPSLAWVVYILRCSDDSLYTGITNNLDRRLLEHNDRSQQTKAAKYTRARQPVKLIYQEHAESRSHASRREYQIKQLSRTQKIQLINS